MRSEGTPMKRVLLVVVPLAALFATLLGRPGHVPALPLPGGDQPDSKKFEDFDKVVKGAKEYDGLFKLHHKDDKLYAEIKPDLLDKPLLCPIAVARGGGLGGFTLNFDEQWVLVFKRVGDKVHLIRRNVRFKAKSGSPAAHAVETTYTDSVLMALKIVAINQNQQSLLINFNDIFMTDFAQLNLGAFDANRSVWHKVKAFKDNVELEVAATFDGGNAFRFFGGGDGVIDSRGNTVVIHYGLCRLPESGYVPRLADDRVGFFLSVVKDFSSDKEDTAFLRYVNRWRLERAEPPDPKHPNRLSPPKKKIVFWIEKSVPDEYRAAVREGILEWNKAFEKIGFRDAIEVRQQENEDFDPEDINYNTFRWITTDMGFAMGPSRANPLTGEILDADIVFDASMVRFWRQEAQLFKGDGGQPASLIQATRQGWGLLSPLSPWGRGVGGKGGQGWNDPPLARRASEGSAEPAARMRLQAIRQGVCQCGAHMRYELGLAAMALAARDQLKPGDKVPDDLVNQAIKEVTMHEVGHTLGLRHNFKASTMLKNEQLHDTAVTRKQGLVGSVMDYAPINLAPRGVKQGDYFSTTIGPYDYWAIEYAYKPLTGGTEGEWEKLQEIARHGAKPGHDYATDEDMMSADPLVNAWDLGSDTMKFAQDRMLLAEELMQGMAERVVDKGEGYQRARQAFNILLMQYGNGAYLVASHIGGEHVHRDHRDDPGGRDPFVPVKADRQRQALHFLSQHILSDRPFQFPPALLRKLAADRWMHWGNEGVFRSVEYPLHERILAIQRVVLGQVYDGNVLSRIQNNALKVDENEKPVTIAEVFRGVTDAVWSDLKEAREGKDGKEKKLLSSVVRRNLQREQLKELFALVLGEGKDGSSSGGFPFFFRRPPAPPDARSLARMHLREINGRIKGLLGDPLVKLDDTCRAHLEECQERIAKVLNASMQVSEP
jgi:hypothetical protein